MFLCNSQGRRTEKPGGTEASFPVSLANVDNGIIVFACGAGGWVGEEAWKVA